MNPHDATEQAYRNGYEAGYNAAKDEIVHCKDCVYSYFVSQYSKCECSRLGILLFSDDFCSFGERKED